MREHPDWGDCPANFFPAIDDALEIHNAALAIAKLGAAGFVVDDDRGFPMRKVCRAASDTSFVWLDTGNTVCVLGDASDTDDALYFDVIEALDGPEARARAERA